ncbi:MAG TPA: hypothetical protein VF762_06665 [Blastocatellia bacterium]|jgi:hypothetical protein
MLTRITNGYIDDATDEQRRLIYECAIKILGMPKSHEPENHGDENESSEGLI